MAVTGEWVRNQGPSGRGLIQRCSCGAGKSCDSCASRKKRRLSRRGQGAATLDHDTKQRVLAVLKERGEPLDRGVRGVMERALGASFRDVRIHRDGEAARTASLLSASAYTVGRHIVFGEGRFVPSTMTGLQLLAHELTHIVQQRGQAESGIEDLIVGPEDDALERAARDVAASIGIGQRVVVGGGSVDTAPAQAVVQREQRVCGPDVTNQIFALWNRIERVFKTQWNSDKQAEACRYLIAPYPNAPFDWTQNINAFDTIPLCYGGAVNWLMRSEVLDIPCGIPSPLDQDREAELSQAAAEARNMCSVSVAVRGKCWLSGTVNYGTYGMMMSICDDVFPTSYWPYSAAIKGFGFPPMGFSIGYGESLIRAYKARGGTMKEHDIAEPIAWYQAVYNGGAGAAPSMAGNRSSCDASGKDCTVDGSIVNWDYVWEPYKPRTKNMITLDVSKLPRKKAPEPKPAANDIQWAIGWWKVWDENDYYYYFYGDNDVIYIKTPPKKTWIPPKSAGRKGRVEPLEHGLKCIWPPFSDEDATTETFTRMNSTSTTEMFAVSTKYSPLSAKKL